ncbi:hypothetical protein SPFM15_00185 [Salmonella phage SPFM15]|nr:hypothetical protein SPFM5_00180 [Salmonella phage SPFM5]VFR13809.1 hypothetical protein SPFM15_00185 [Salmonella phage SPFM15]
MSEMILDSLFTKFGYPLAEQRKVVHDFMAALRSTFSHDGRTHRVRWMHDIRAKHGSCSLHFRVSADYFLVQVDIDAKYLGGGVKRIQLTVSKNGDLEDVAQALRAVSEVDRRMFYRELQLCTAALHGANVSCA